MNDFIDMSLEFTVICHDNSKVSNFLFFKYDTVTTWGIADGLFDIFIIILKFKLYIIKLHVVYISPIINSCQIFL